jgi:hypothetical protein
MIFLPGLNGNRTNNSLSTFRIVCLKQMTFAMSYNFLKQNKGKSLSVSSTELRSFLICQLLWVTWSSWENVCTGARSSKYLLSAKNLSQDRFFTIRRNLKFLVYDDVEPETKTTDRLWKVRPLLEALRQQYLTLKRELFLSIYEQMIPFAGGWNLKQYVPNKSNTLGLKNFVLAGSSGLAYDFTIYQGKKNFTPRPAK